MLVLSEFYKHPMMHDGYLNKCKECTRKDSRENYSVRWEAKRDYERLRSKRVSRKISKADCQRRRRLRHPEKMRAYNMVAYALRTGTLKKKPCLYCGSEKVQAHHHDYLKPLDVVWVCFSCHRRVEHGQRTE